MQEYCIIANSPTLRKNLISKAISGKEILALDGAVSILRKHLINPDIIFGDFDSIDLEMQTAYGIKPILESNTPYAGKQGVLIIPAYNQNLTDLEKAIQYCDNKSLKDITIIGATGGREDHHEALKIALKQNYNPLRKILVHSDYGTMCYVENQKVSFHGKPGDICGFVLQSNGSVTSDGLLYQCLGHNYSISNKMLENVASFCVSGGALLFLPLQLK
jgi:thiamine pyrophosphokinase